MSQDITIRYNFGRMIATFDSIENMNRWIRFYFDSFFHPYMYTIHGHGGEQNLEKYMKTL